MMRNNAPASAPFFPFFPPRNQLKRWGNKGGREMDFCQIGRNPDEPHCSQWSKQHSGCPSFASLPLPFIYDEGCRCKSDDCENTVLNKVLYGAGKHHHDSRSLFLEWFTLYYCCMITSVHRFMYCLARALNISSLYEVMECTH